MFYRKQNLSLSYQTTEARTSASFVPQANDSVELG